MSLIISSMNMLELLMMSKKFRWVSPRRFSGSSNKKNAAHPDVPQGIAQIVGRHAYELVLELV